MSFILDSALAEYIGGQTQSDGRYPSPGLIRFAQDQTKMFRGLTEDLKRQIQTANGRSLSIPAISDREISVGDVITFDVDDNLASTTRTAITIFNIWGGFAFYPHAHASNAVSAEEYYASSLLAVDRAIAKELAAQIYTVLNARKTQVWDAKSGIDAGYVFANDTLSVSHELIKGAPMFANIDTMFFDNELDGSKSWVGNAGIKSTLDYKNTYGANNNQNLSDDTPPKIYLDNTGNYTNAAGVGMTAHAVRDGAIALVQSYPSEFMKSEETYDAKWEIGSQALPISGIVPLSIVQKAKANISGLDGAGTHTASTKELIGIGGAFAILHTYNRDLSTVVNDVVRIEGEQLNLTV